jgi:hypothetical protein
MIIYKHIYILKILLSIVTDDIKALVVSGLKFLYACVKEVCRSWAEPSFDTFYQLLIIVEVMWSQPGPQVGKQVEVAWSEVRAVKRVVK